MAGDRVGKRRFDRFTISATQRTLGKSGFSARISPEPPTPCRAFFFSRHILHIRDRRFLPALRSMPPRLLVRGAERNPPKTSTFVLVVDSPVTFSGREAPHTHQFCFSLRTMQKIEDWLAERSEFELPVPVSKLSDDNVVL